MSQVNLTNVNQLQTLYQADQANEVEWASPADKQAFDVEVAKYRSGDGSWKADSFNKASIPTPKAVFGEAFTMEMFNNAGSKVDYSFTQILSLLHETGVQLKQAGKEARSADRDAQITSMKAEAQQIRAAAKAAFTSAMISGGMQIAGGAMSMGSAGYSSYKVSQAGKLSSGNATKRQNLKTQNKQLRVTQKQTQQSAGAQSKKLKSRIQASKDQMQQIKSSNASRKQKTSDMRAETKQQQKLIRKQHKVETRAANKKAEIQKQRQANKEQINTLDANDAQAGRYMQHSQNVSYVGQAASQMVSGVGTMIAAAFDLQAGEARALEREQAAVTVQAEHTVQDSQEVVDAAREFIQKAAQTLQEIQQNEAQVASKIWA